jgi:hypothetical protein
MPIPFTKTPSNPSRRPLPSSSLSLLLPQTAGHATPSPYVTGPLRSQASPFCACAPANRPNAPSVCLVAEVGGEDRSNLPGHSPRRMHEPRHLCPTAPKRRYGAVHVSYSQAKIYGVSTLAWCLGGLFPIVQIRLTRPRI